MDNKHPCGCIQGCINCAYTGWRDNVPLDNKLNKPHLRLHYKATDSGRPTKFNWEVEYVRGPSKRARRRSYWHNTSWGALASAATLWFPDWSMPLRRLPYRKPR